MNTQSPLVDSPPRTRSQARNVSARASIADICKTHRLLTRGADGIFRVPFLVKGELRVPAEISRAEIERAFRAKDDAAGPSDSAATYVRVADVQVLREPVIDRASGKRTGEWSYSTMPTFDADEVIDSDLDALARDLYDLPFSAVLDYVDGLRAAFEASPELIDSVRAATLATSELPDIEHDLGFAAVPMLLAREMLQRAVDEDLAMWGHPGTALLDGWCAARAAELVPAPCHGIIGAADPRGAFRGRVPDLRALPTRQLHITAGNAPHIPFFSALRALMTKSPAVVKSPYGATMPGALLALMAVASNPDHPITKHLSLVYWPGGDEEIETKFFMPGAFERIVVWGAPAAVASVKSRALFAKVLTFDPRYGVSLLGREAFAPDCDLDELAATLASDVLVANQKACIATQVVYVESENEADLARLAASLQAVLAKVDVVSPNIMTPAQRGEILRLMKGRFLDADWYVNEREGAFTSGVVVAHDEFSVAALPMCRLVVLRPVRDLQNATTYMHHGVSTASVWPESRRRALRTIIAAHGVSSVVPLGQSGAAFAGQTHDGMRVLSELVDWKAG